jgi:very-short-patch-repair endonuclease
VDGKASAAGALDRLASLQHGLVRQEQLREMGLSRRQISGWTARGHLDRVAPRTYRLAGTPETWEQALLSAVLAAGTGAVASHRAAAALWDLLEGPARVVELTVPHPRLPRIRHAVVHRSRDLTVDVTALRRRIPVTNPLRTIVDLGAVVPAPQVEDALDRALTRRLLSVAGAEAARARVARPGRDGAGVLRRVLDDRALGHDPADSLLESRMARLLRSAGLPAPAFQHDVVVHGHLVARVDFAYPEVSLAIEVDGLAAHGSATALQADLERQNALVAAGWVPLRFTWADVVRRPAAVATAVQERLCALAHRDGA